MFVPGAPTASSRTPIERWMEEVHTGRLFPLYANRAVANVSVLLRMDKERKLIVAGNWKSNKTNSEAVALVTDLIRELAAVKEVDVVVCSAFTALSDVSKLILGDRKSTRLNSSH
jgi:hypothetical protein